MLFAGYLQGDLLDQVLVPTSEGGGLSNDEDGLQED